MQDGLKKDPHFGLASDNHGGRTAAVELGHKACAAVGRLRKAIGSGVAIFVELHSAPSRHSQIAKTAGVSSSAASLAASLKDLLSLDWQGAQLVLEHCDWYGGVKPDKGFLSLEEDILALKMVNSGVGDDKKIFLTINWARSVLETQKAENVVSHIKSAKAADLLGGLMFSGCSGEESPWGQWTDFHMPHGPAEGIEHFADVSFMTATEIKKCIEAAGGPQGCKYIGAKFSAKHVGGDDVATRVGLARDMLKLLSAESVRLAGSPNGDRMRSRSPPLKKKVSAQFYF